MPVFRTGMLLTLLLYPCLSKAWQTSPTAVTGIVHAADGTPLSGVSVKDASGKKGVFTNDKGEYELMVNSTQTSLEFSYVGYFTKRVKLNGHTSINTVLSADDKNLQEVVVGTQRQSKKTTTAAISSVSGKQIENLPAPTVDQLLQGRVAGLDVQINSGEPGASPTVVVRGNTRVSQNVGNVDQARALSGPLYVIDGVPVNPEDVSGGLDITGTNYLAGINVNDIESLDVQKDAAATAAWGSRGANGVIYIRTRKGRSNKPEFRVNVYGGITKQPELLPTLTGAEERKQKLALIKEYATPAVYNALPHILTDSLNPQLNAATDWQGLFYRNGAVQNADMSISAATDNVNYRLSANYYNEKGVIEAFGLKRYSLRGNFDFRISPKFTSQFIVALSRSDRQRGRKLRTSDDNLPLTGSGIPASFYQLNSFDSLSYQGMYSKVRNQNTDGWYSASLTLNYDILPGLRFTTMGTASVTTNNRDYFMPSNIDAIKAGQDDADAQPSYAESGARTYSNYFLSNTLNYAKSFNKHHLTITGSQQYNKDISKYTIASAYNLPSNDIQTVTGAPQQYLAASSDYQQSALLSFMGQAQYDFDQKYIVYLADRADASSRFGAASKWGSFPSAGAAWIISDEGFMKGTRNWLNMLKVRGSIGKSGSQSNDYYAPFNAYVINGTYDGNTAISPSYTNGLTKDNLTWATTVQKSVALETQLFNNRVSLVTDIYDKVTKNDYFTFNLPFYVGYDNITANANNMWISNRGVEVTLITHNLSPKSKLQWNTQLNLAFNKNVIAKLPNNNRTFVIDDYYGIGRMYSVGQPIYEMFQLKYQGVYNTDAEVPVNPITGKKLTYFKGNYAVQAGYPKWADVNHDYDVWSDESQKGDQFGDRVATGNPNPKFTGGLVNDFSYKNFSLSIISTFAWKRTIVNTFQQQQFSQVWNYASPYSNIINALASKRLPSLDGLNYWRPSESAKNSNYKADFPSLDPYGPNYYQFSAFTNMFNEDGSYFKIKSIILGYKMPDNIISRLKLKGARIYGVIDNIHTFTKAHVPDPEAVNALGVYTGGMFPVPHKVTLGIDVQF
ncbi:SusC/RagA family TonB-linked outer membrane protein [Deminuibacter soli]|nr:SusC/RagA family TonB-linked outer membrane protein [Deminuibacter soli]